MTDFLANLVIMSSKSAQHTALSPARSYLAEHDIELRLTRKHVKNVNFRVKPYQLSISAPHRLNDDDLAHLIQSRIEWAINAHAKLIAKLRQSTTPPATTNPFVNSSQSTPLVLWGETKNETFSQQQILDRYRTELQRVMPDLFAKWQPIVGKFAHETRIKRMRTRWGSCNVRAKRVWLSVYLPSYPIQCTEYVIVHELCHLHHANHSPKFWQAVEAAMPDYQVWHDMLAGKNRSVD